MDIRIPKDKRLYRVCVHSGYPDVAEEAVPSMYYWLVDKKLKDNDAWCKLIEILGKWFRDGHSDWWSEDDNVSFAEALGEVTDDFYLENGFEVVNLPRQMGEMALTIYSMLIGEENDAEY